MGEEKKREDLNYIPEYHLYYGIAIMILG